MTAVMHTPLNLENFPPARQGKVDMDYAALTLRVKAARQQLNKTWLTLPEESKARMYALASKALLREEHPVVKAGNAVQVGFLVMGLVLRGQLEAFSAYLLEQRDLLSDVLSLSEEDRPQWKADVRMALEGIAHIGQNQKPLKGPDDIRAYLEQL